MGYFPVSKSKCRPVTLSKQELKEIFESYRQPHGKRVLGTAELTKAFEYLGALMPSNEASAALRFIDRDCDNEINTEKEINDLVRYAYRNGYR